VKQTPRGLGRLGRKQTLEDHVVRLIAAATASQSTALN